MAYLISPQLHLLINPALFIYLLTDLFLHFFYRFVYFHYFFFHFRTFDFWLTALTFPFIPRKSCPFNSEINGLVFNDFHQQAWNREIYDSRCLKLKPLSLFFEPHSRQHRPVRSQYLHGSILLNYTVLYWNSTENKCH